MQNEEIQYEEYINEIGYFAKLRSNLESLQWAPGKIEILLKNYEGSINQIATVLQTLRSEMGDVHGTKKEVKSLIFLAIKWATAICSILYI